MCEWVRFWDNIVVSFTGSPSAFTGNPSVFTGNPSVFTGNPSARDDLCLSIRPWSNTAEG